MLAIKRIYDPSSETDGERILVDRLWPRGVSKKKADLDEWLKDLAPSNELRKWFQHDPEKWSEFKEKYLYELKEKGDLINQIMNQKDKITLLYSAKDEEHNNAVALKEFIEKGWLN